MDTTKLLDRVRGILLNPATEWGVIAGETTTVSGLYKNYIMLLAIIPAIFGFIKGSLIGFDVPLLGSYRVGIGAGISGMVITYAMSLAQIYVVALVVDTLAPAFGGQKSMLQAIKTVAYAFTAAWVASIGQIVPWLGTLIVLAGAVYSIYLLYLGLPRTMGCPPERAVAYTAVSIVAAIILSLVIGAVVGAVTGSFGPPGPSLGSDTVQIDKNSPLGKLEGYADKLEEASKKVEAAQQSGDAAAQGEAVGAMIGAAMGGGAVEALAPEQLQAFVPESLAGLPRTTIAAERNAAMGMQVAVATASFGSDSGRVIDLEITDTGSAKGMLALAGMASLEEDQITDQGYSRTYRADGRMVHEEWDNGGHGEYMKVIGERFTVKVSGTVESIDVLKAALDEIDLDGLEALKDEGVKDR